MNLRDKAPILICVDLQKGFSDEKYWGGGRNNKDAEVICSVIIKEWRDICKKSKYNIKTSTICCYPTDQNFINAHTKEIIKKN